jgi:hypothetical protein
MTAKKQIVLISLAVLISALYLIQPATAHQLTAAATDRAHRVSPSKAVPGQLSYQGFLADAADSSAVTATLEMTFRLFDSETKGAELWSETHPAVEVAGGLFHVQLGSVTPFPPGLFDGTPLWLQTEAGTEIFLPRKPLVSVAYSYRANSAERLLDFTLVELDDRWVNEEDLNHLNATDGNPANAVYVDATGEVGIGTTSPDRQLHIYDDTDGLVGIDIENPNTGNGSIEMITFTDESGGLAGLAAYDDGNTYPSALRLYNNRPDGTIGLVAGGLERIRVSNDGKVGIGKTSPGYTLDINGDVSAATYWGDGSHLTGISGAPDADWTIAGSDMYSGVPGNVGIGTASPFQRLDVNGNVKADSIFLGSSSKAGLNGGLLLQNAGAADPVIELGDHIGFGGKVTLRDTSGLRHTRLEPDYNGAGGYLQIYRNDYQYAFIVDGNYEGSEEPLVSISGSSREVHFAMDDPGDSSVILPTGAVSAGEIRDEPGVSNDLGKSFFFLSSGHTGYTVDTLEITIPAPGYVEVTGGCYLNLFHSQGTKTEIWVNIDQVAGNADWTLPGAKVASVPDTIPTTLWQFPCTSTRMYQETTAGLKRYYLNAYYYTGTDTMTNVARSYLSAAYYPTLYGSLTLAETDGGTGRFAATRSAGDGTEFAVEPPRRTITREEHNARLEAEMAALRTEVEKLREEVRNQR